MAEERLLAEAEEALSLAEGLCRILRGMHTALARELGLSRAGLELLWVVGQRPEGVSVREAAGVLGVRPQGLSTLAVQLESQGLLLREKDPSDNRTRRLMPSPAGHELLARVREIRHQWVRAVISAVPQPAVARLVLQRLGAAFHKAMP